MNGPVPNRMSSEVGIERAVLLHRALTFLPPYLALAGYRHGMFFNTPAKIDKRRIMLQGGSPEWQWLRVLSGSRGCQRHERAQDEFV
jgi:hypothetical protein